MKPAYALACAAAVFLFAETASAAEMPYPSALYFAPDLNRVPCALAAVPDFLCTAGIPLPRPDSRKKETVPIPHSDPRTHNAAN